MAFLKPDKTEVWNGVKVNKYFLTEHNPCKISMPQTPMPDYKKLGITIHNTDRISVANGTTCAEQYLRATVNNYMKDVRVHFYVDSECIWWCLPLDLSSWHAADGNGNGNLCTISIECIMSGNYDAIDKKAEDNAARLISYLMKKYGWNINNLFTHTHWLAVKSGRKGTREYLNETKLPNGQKWCPLYILPHFSAFEKRVQSYLGTNNNQTVIDVKPDNAYTSSAYKKDDIVGIKNGAVYMSGEDVPTWVSNKRWHIFDITGTRVILGKSEDGKNDIQSPIDVKYLIPSTTNNSSQGIVDVVDYTVTVNPNTVIYKNPDGVSKVGVIEKRGTYTITHTCCTYGKLKSGAGWIDISNKTQSVDKTIKIGDWVKVIKNEQYNGKPFKVYVPKYKVLEIKNDRIIISSDGIHVTTAINIRNIEKI